MLKTKYERMNRQEKKKVIMQYKKTEKGKEMFNRLYRLTIVGILLLLYVLYWLFSKQFHLQWNDYCVVIPIGLIGFFFLFMTYRLRKKVLNQFVLQKK